MRDLLQRTLSRIPDHGASVERAHVSSVLEKVGMRDGIKDLRLNHEGTASLRLTGGKKINFEYQEGTRLLLLYMPLIDLPRDEKRRLALLEHMLERNFLKLRTGDGELSLMREGDQAIYQVALPATGLNVERLDSAIDKLLAQYEACMSALENAMFSTAPRLPVARQDNSRNPLLAMLRGR